MNHHHQHIYDLCKNHMHSYVLVEMNDGSNFDGIITGLDDEYVYFAVPLGQDDGMPHGHHHRQFGWGSYNYPGFYGHGYHHRPRRFRRLILPLAALAAISVLPWY
ncbi:hypothetical protein [Virgibacillus siamensis]|uniref:hypothetical protein n=1 Tax=Virgibacillus siamensis TaxID=480071 RepID=UPI00098465C7|nr:hypothetical protein [Virgibacillus siamensis]